MQSHSRWMAAGFLTTLMAVAILFAPATALADSSYPTDPAEAQRFYESRVDDWADGPANLLMTEREAKMWKALGSTQERRGFIIWFWARRNPDLRTRDNEARTQFYERVAEANRKYRDFPRGWNSDRGRVHVVLGRPHGVRPTFGYSADAVVWTYYTVGPRSETLPIGSTMGQFSVAFVRRSGRAGYEIYSGFGGPGMYPQHVRDAFRFAAEASIVNPDLRPYFS